ncbi:MAG: glycine cleavage system protein GcvH [Gammaproteobacteria bacterium]|jgi:glycine cleavage system H protein|nr:glycine cleavage system protein GcvH [Gammaproteobacteria bacterium]
MSIVPSELKYVKTHEWIRDEGGGVVTVGITDHAQKLLGDLVFVELPEVGSQVQTESECAVVESVKAASDVYSPVTGEIVAVNTDLADAPETINEDPYESGWLFKVQLADPEEYERLMDADAYIQLCAAENE